jgi:hypothetical protein
MISQYFTRDSASFFLHIAMTKWYKRANEARNELGIQLLIARARKMFRSTAGTAIGPPLNKAGLTSGGCLPCQNDNKFLITERS